MLVYRNHINSIRLHLLGYSITLLSGGVYLIRSEELAKELITRGYVEEYKGSAQPIGTEDLDQNGYAYYTGGESTSTGGWIPKYQTVLVI